MSKLRSFVNKHPATSGIGLTIAAGVIAFLLLVWMSPPASPAPSPYAVARAAVHQLFDTENKEGSGCSGVMIAPMTMLASAHCLVGTKQLEAGVDRVPAKVLKQDEASDLLLLRVAIQCPCVPVGVALAAVDEPVVAIGFPINNIVKVQIVTEGLAQSLSGLPGETGQRLRFSAPVISGNSGGGLFAYRNGRWELVGIVSALIARCGQQGCQAVSHLGLASGLDVIKPFLAPTPPAYSCRSKKCRQKRHQDALAVKDGAGGV